MINIGASLLSAVLVSLLLNMGLKIHLGFAIPGGLVIGIGVLVLLSRRVQAKMEAIMLQMQRDVQANKLDRAIETVKQGLSLKRWQVFIEGQVNSQIGILYYLKKDRENAFEYLKKGFVKHFVGQGMLAVLYYRQKEYDQMKKVMDSTISSNKKESLVYGLYAYLLYQIKDKEKAIAIVQQGLKKLPEDERLKTNLNLLQNNKKMKMKVYGEMWMQFMLERAPRMMQEPPKHMRMSRKAMFR